jgi:hypothetical protein
MSKTSSKQRLEVLQNWIQWTSRQKGYPKAKVKTKKETEY